MNLFENLFQIENTSPGLYIPLAEYEQTETLIRHHLSSVLVSCVYSILWAGCKIALICVLSAVWLEMKQQTDLTETNLQLMRSVQSHNTFKSLQSNTVDSRA